MLNRLNKIFLKVECYINIAKYGVNSIPVLQKCSVILYIWSCKASFKSVLIKPSFPGDH